MGSVGLAGLLAVAAFGCTSEDPKVRITGRIPAGWAGKNLKDGTLSLDEAARVLVFCPGSMSQRSYNEVYDIVDGSFTAEAFLGSAVALIFLTAENEYIGHLRASELSFLPLGQLADGAQTVIDLATLSQDGTQILPERDPFGDTILANADEREALRQVDGMYEAVVRDLDVDRDGVIDAEDLRDLIVFANNFSLYVGTWGVDDTPPSSYDASQLELGFELVITTYTPVPPDVSNVTLSGPAEDPFAEIGTVAFFNRPEVGAPFYARFRVPGQPPPGSPFGTYGVPFRNGTYQLTFDQGLTRTFTYSGFDPGFFLVIISPTLHTQADGRVTSVTFDYALPDGRKVDAAAVLRSMWFQLAWQQDPQARGFDSPILPASGGLDVFEFDSPMDLTELDSFSINYDDLLGNNYVIIWMASEP